MEAEGGKLLYRQHICILQVSKVHERPLKGSPEASKGGSSQRHPKAGWTFGGQTFAAPSPARPIWPSMASPLCVCLLPLHSFSFPLCSPFSSSSSSSFDIPPLRSPPITLPLELPFSSYSQTTPKTTSYHSKRDLAPPSVVCRGRKCENLHLAPGGVSRCPLRWVLFALASPEATCGRRQTL